MEYDSTQDTQKHINRVNTLLTTAAIFLLQRGRDHDKTKLENPEKAIFDEYTPKLKKMEYGSEEYKECLVFMGEALQHHYIHNGHHPEHFKNGVNDMTLIDIIEMFCDWKAASERHETGDILKSIEINKERFELSDQLAAIFENTAKLMTSE